MPVFENEMLLLSIAKVSTYIKMSPKRPNITLLYWQSIPIFNSERTIVTICTANIQSFYL